MHVKKVKPSLLISVIILNNFVFKARKCDTGICILFQPTERATFNYDTSIYRFPIKSKITYEEKITMNINFIMSLFKHYLMLRERNKINKIKPYYIYIRVINKISEFFDITISLREKNQTRDDTHG